MARGHGAEWHSLAPSRSGRGLHVRHGRRRFRLVGRSGQTIGDLGDEAVILWLILFPVLVHPVVQHVQDVAEDERERVQEALALLAPVIGRPPPGVTVRGPWPGWLLTTGRVLTRLVLGAAALGGAGRWFWQTM